MRRSTEENMAKPPRKNAPGADFAGAHEERDGLAYAARRVNPDQKMVKWRFRRGTDQLWRWQKMTADQSIIAESRKSFAGYAECIADAAAEGYVHPPAASGLSEPL